MLMWLVHSFIALLVAGFANMFLVSSGAVSPHNGAPAFLVFAVVLAVLRLFERQPSGSTESVVSDQPKVE